MNILRLLYPLRLRQSFYSRIISKRFGFPHLPPSGSRLHFAAASLPALLPTDWGHRQIAWLGFYELELSRRIVALAQEGGLLVDVGANIGYFSCLWAAASSRNSVCAFEASPRNFPMLQRNVAAQSVSERVKLFEQAVGKEQGTLAFDVGPQEQSGWGGLTNSASAQTLEVNVGRLDDLLPAESQVSVLKIDTEGADAWVLAGAERLLRNRQIQHIFYEENLERMAQLGIAPRTAVQFLTGLGYKVSNLDHSPNEFHASLT